MIDREKLEAMMRSQRERMDDQFYRLKNDPVVRYILSRPAPGQREYMQSIGKPLPPEEPYPEPVPGGYKITKQA